MICGIDEAGRGPLAGPVTAAAVILPEDFPRGALDDSKKLSARKRETARALILRRAVAWGIGWASPAEIDSLNILQASLLAMKRAFDEMTRAFAAVLAPAGGPRPALRVIVDGLFAPDIPAPCEPVVKADALVPEVMAASILAKTARDAEMERYGALYPEYGYGAHKGYPTKAHREAIARHGPSPIQRLSFRVGE